MRRFCHLRRRGFESLVSRRDFEKEMIARRPDVRRQACPRIPAERQPRGRGRQEAIIKKNRLQSNHVTKFIPYSHAIVFSE